MAPVRLLDYRQISFVETQLINKIYGDRRVLLVVLERHFRYVADIQYEILVLVVKVLIEREVRIQLQNLSNTLAAHEHLEYVVREHPVYVYHGRPDVNRSNIQEDEHDASSEVLVRLGQQKDLNKGRNDLPRTQLVNRVERAVEYNLNRLVRYALRLVRLHLHQRALDNVQQLHDVNLEIVVVVARVRVNSL